MIIEFEEKLLDLIDAQVVNASSDELFAGGYLEAARSELSPADRAIVAELWQQLAAQA